MQRGEYFYKKEYIPEAIPSFAQYRDQLPAPILDDHPEWIDLYWAAWKIGFTQFLAPPKGSPLVSNYMDEGFSPNIFQWDTIFMTQFGGYAQHIFPVIRSLDNFYSRQHTNGYIDREIEEKMGKDAIYRTRNDTINPPLFAWAEVENAHLTGDTSRYTHVFLPLVKYAEYLETARHSLQAKHKLYWNTGLGAGMDNTPRTGSGWVDMSCQMAMMYRALGEIALTLGKNNESLKFNKFADDIAQRIQQFMWDEADGLFYDVDNEGRFVKHKTIASFWPLIAHIATDIQAKRLMTNLKDPKTFWRSHPWPSLAADESEYTSQGHYWLGGVWAPTNAMVLKGLNLYPGLAGSLDLAKTAAEKDLENLSSVYKQSGTIWEFYKPDSQEPGEIWWFLHAHPNFVGWSGLGPIQFLIEDVIGIHVDALHHEILWNIQRNSHHGIRNLHLGKSIISLETAARKNASDKSEITANLQMDPTDRQQSYTLIISLNGKQQRFKLKQGPQLIN